MDWRRFFENLGMICEFSTAYHPQTDGQTERVNRVIREVLRVTCRYKPDQWGFLLQATEFGYNTTVHSSTGLSPAHALFGYDPQVPASFQQHYPTDENGFIALDRSEHLRSHHWAVADAIAWSQCKQAASYNRRHRKLLLNVGDSVLISRKAFGSVVRYDKTLPLYFGPYTVVEANVGGNPNIVRLLIVTLPL